MIFFGQNLVYSKILLYLCSRFKEFAAAMTEQDIEMRAQRAIELFKQGFNCAQAVFASCADLYGITDEKLALRLSASFGGGMGRMRLVCGAASGMFMLAGLQNGSATPHDNDGKMANYALVRDLAGQFKEQYGSLICAELLGLAPRQEDAPSCRKAPCQEMVAEAVRIFLKNTNEV